MLTALAIRDVVLIERLDLAFGPGLTALTGETGAGKSILLDSFGLALGARAEAGLVRAGAAQAAVTASFAPPPGHPAFAVLEELGLEAEDGAIALKRVLGADGRGRAFVNDAPVAVATLRRLAALLVEVQGQHDQVGLADPATHLDLLDAFGDLSARRAAVARAWAAWSEARRALAAAETAIAEARAEEEFLRHAVAELTQLAPEEGEEQRLAESRTAMQQHERRAEAIATALSSLAGERRRGRADAGPGAALREAARALERLPPPHDAVAPALSAIGRADDALSEAISLLERLATDAEPDPRALERTEERLFALRAAARKHATSVTALPALATSLAARLAALDAGEAGIATAQRAVAEARAAYVASATALAQARATAAARLEKAVTKELPPLKLDRTVFRAALEALPEPRWGAAGSDACQFLIATNPGSPPGPIEKIASGGELSRLMLALKLVLARGSSVGTLVFDEVDSGIGGATAAAVGERLARLAEATQILVVTHSPQVAARADAQARVAKRVHAKGAVTVVEPLSGDERREELARMLAGETVTDAARAAADSLLAR
jgi:DNA repair protein RecN (Recombination protein N)